MSSEFTLPGLVAISKLRKNICTSVQVGVEEEGRVACSEAAKIIGASFTSFRPPSVSDYNCVAADIRSTRTTRIELVETGKARCFCHANNYLLSLPQCVIKTTCHQKSINKIRSTKDVQTSNTCLNNEYYSWFQPFDDLVLCQRTF